MFYCLGAVDVPVAEVPVVVAVVPLCVAAVFWAAVCVAGAVAAAGDARAVGVGIELFELLMVAPDCAGSAFAFLDMAISCGLAVLALLEVFTCPGTAGWLFICAEAIPNASIAPSVKNNFFI